jgi:hypothetical protein
MILATDLNLFNPHGHFTLFEILVLAVALGMVHGITPDEHTWPITFSYSIGSYSARRGIVAGLTFSAAFTVQRALASELAYFALAKVMLRTWWLNYLVYLLVGAAMYVAARYLFSGKHWHLLQPAHHIDEWRKGKGLSDAKWWMPAVHGFIAGWGVGAFALIVYTVLAPQMPNAALGWIPGFAFGIGTMLMQALAGGLFGFVARRLKLTASDIKTVALVTAGRTLLIGGVSFVVAGIFGLLFPNLASFQIETAIKVHNLHELGIAQLLVIFIVVVVGFGTLISQTKRLARERSCQDCDEVSDDSLTG